MMERHEVRTDEAGAELQGFQDLFARFQSTSESLERSYSELQDRVRQLSAELEAEREQRIELERMAAMGEMSMELAHEIRNPLGSIELYASMIDGPYAEQIVRGVRLLNHSVTNILQFGQPIYPQIDDLQLAELGEGVQTFLTPLAEEKGIRITCDIESGCAVRGDFELLHRMLLNLVLNALREAPQGGTIRLRAQKVGGNVSILVEDDGPGIPSGALARIFDPMFSASKDGCGLGLSIVKRIVDSHGGTIQVDSNSQGTRFDVRIAATADHKVASRRDEVGASERGIAIRTEAAGGVH